MTIIDSQFYIIDSLALDASLELNADLVDAWLYAYVNVRIKPTHTDV